MNHLLAVLWIAFCLTGCTAVKGQNFKAEIQAADIVFDASTGEIKYTLSEPALVRIRIGVRDGGPLLTHLLDWEYREKGEHKEIWDGKIQGSDVDFRGRGDLMAVFKAVPAGERNNTFDLIKKAPQLTIDFLESKGNDENGLPIINGRVPLRVMINSADDAWLSNTRYETGIYIDHVFLTEEEEGINPFTYYLDTEKFSDGVHTVTVTVASYGGTAGAQSGLVLIKNGKEENEARNE